MKLIKHFLLYISICISSFQIVPIFSNHELLQENAGWVKINWTTIM